MTISLLRYVFLGLLLLVTGCGRTPLFSTPIPTYTLAPTLTLTPTPQPTSPPTWTPTATATQTPPPTATSTAVPSPTPLFGEGTPTPELEGRLTQRWGSTSPDGNWVAHVTVVLPVVDGETVGEAAYTEVSVTQTDGSVTWYPIDDWSPYGLGFPTPQKFHWSEDALYFSLHAVPDGCSVFGSDVALLRLDLREGTLTNVAPDLSGALSLSPNERRLAYLEENEVVIRDLETGEERRVAFDSETSKWRAGNLTWSPSGEQLAFTVVHTPCTLITKHSVWVVNVENLVSTAIIQEDDRRFLISGWRTDETLLLNDIEGIAWRLEVEGGTLSLID
ncbi:MAG: hypothetical protein ACP5GX_10280 [Anaerolineae bacterium]